MMSNNRPWYNLKISTQHAISESGNSFFKSLADKNELAVLELTNCDFLNPSWVSELEDGICNKLSSAMVFYRPANMQWPTAHIDLNTKMIKTTNEIHTPNAAINLIYNGAVDDSEMVWYETPAITVNDVKWTTADTAYLEFDPATLIEVDRHCIGQNLSLVRTDIPHNIIMGDSPRLSISLRFRFLEWKDPSWEGVVNQCKGVLENV